MKSKISIIVLCLSILFSSSVVAQNLKSVPAVPLEDVLNVSVRPVSISGVIPIPLIAWGADVATIHTDMEGIFRDQGLTVNFFSGDNFPKQVEMCASGKTPYLRGTLAMINSASEFFKQSGINLVTLDQLSWSDGGDCMVVRPHIKKLSDIKKVALQRFGPHMDYVGNLFTSAKVSLKNVTFVYFDELTFPKEETGSIIDPVSAFQKDQSIDAVMCISPDAMILTSGGNAGDGSAGSVKGATILVSTKTANRIITDVYAVRSDYNDSHRDDVESFERALRKGQDSYTRLLSTKGMKYNALLSKSAELLMGSSLAIGDVEGMIADCELANFNDNIAFFTGKGTTRNFDNLNAEIQPVLISLGFMRSKVALTSAGWDYASLAASLNFTNVNVSAPAPKKTEAQQAKTQEKVQQYVEQKVAAESDWSSSGSLFEIVINFNVNQAEFPMSTYAPKFDTLIDLMDTYSGAIVTIEGYNDPHHWHVRKEAGDPQAALNAIESLARKNSQERADNGLGGIKQRAKDRKLSLDFSLVVPLGHGNKNALFPKPANALQSRDNRRVVVRLIPVVSESDWQ